MKPDTDYSLVLINLIDELDKGKYQNNNSLPTRRTSSSTYSIKEPAIQVQTDEKGPLLIFDIEIGENISDLIIKKWKDHASKCGFIFLIVPIELKAKAEEICAKELSNYMVIPFQFKKEGKNRTVQFHFP
jgi:hypothetical protein